MEGLPQIYGIIVESQEKRTTATPGCLYRESRNRRLVSPPEQRAAGPRKIRADRLLKRCGNDNRGKEWVFKMTWPKLSNLRHSEGSLVEEHRAETQISPDAVASGNAAQS